MTPVYFSVTNAADSTPVVMDTLISPFNVSVRAVVVSGAPTYTVQATYDDIYAPGWSASTADWVPHPDLTSKLVSATGTYSFPVTAIRVVQTGTGVTSFAVIQAGSGN